MTSFGRHLLDRRILRRDQLEEATQVMVVFGGRLGTILVEAGLLTLEQVEEHLSRHLGLPRAPEERLLRPDPAALGAVPADLARRHMLCPLWIEKRRLHAAMLDPGNANRVDEVAFATGLSIAPYVVAERRLVDLLERHYDIRPDVRFTDSRILDLAGHARTRPNGEGPRRPGAAASDSAEEDERARWRETHGIQPLAEGEELSAKAELADLDTIPDADDATRLAERLLLVSDRNEVAPLVVRLAALHARTAAVFAVRDGMIQGMLAAGETATQRIDTIYVPAEAESMLAGPARGEVFYGAPARSGIDATLVQALGGCEARAVAVLPILVRGRVVHLLYVDNGPDPLAATSLTALGVLCDTMSATWSRLIGESTQAYC